MSRPPSYFVITASSLPFTALFRSVWNHIRSLRAPFRRDGVIDVGRARVDDAHVHARRDRVVEEHRMHRPAHRLVAAKRKAQVRYAAGDIRMRAADADFLARLDEIDAVIIVLFDARRDGEDYGIEDDVLGREAIGGQTIGGPLADFKLAGR